MSIDTNHESEKHTCPEEDQGDDVRNNTNNGGEDLPACPGIGTMGVHAFHQGECAWCGLQDPEY